MKTKVMQVVFLSFFLILFTGKLTAQEKFERMIISYNSSKEHMFISIDGKNFIDEEVNVPKKERHDYNVNPLLKKIKEYEEKGWDLVNINTIHTYEENHSYIEHWAELKKKAK